MGRVSHGLIKISFIGTKLLTRGGETQEIAEIVRGKRYKVELSMIFVGERYAVSHLGAHESVEKDDQLCAD